MSLTDLQITENRIQAGMTTIKFGVLVVKVKPHAVNQLPETKIKIILHLKLHRTYKLMYLIKLRFWYDGINQNIHEINSNCAAVLEPMFISTATAF
jgi:hypothetical protein